MLGLTVLVEKPAHDSDLAGESDRTPIRPFPYSQAIPCVALTEPGAQQGGGAATGFTRIWEYQGMIECAWPKAVHVNYYWRVRFGRVEFVRATSRVL